MKSLLDQLKNRRIKLGLKQHDMLLRAGISRQQYQRLESKGNPRLDTLELVAKGLNSEILLIPQEKLQTVKAVLEGESVETPPGKASAIEEKKRNSVNVWDDPWKGILGDDE
ncbi:helix-turn-helix transcriptional regulator [Porticoccus sp. W117]|uniref:helix-turn-helix domain-containing protein n=1 Tax=Porticoccus sp. W117 TaxID=3054777 RepID=UPI002599BEDD|nr:helix-turn-helix transcriptional regulator [Porticoccus sp. W117]MDM3871071.1 helix-turn-helix transcriptional regulator [Porticoccus sp. W117]